MGTRLEYRDYDPYFDFWTCWWCRSEIDWYESNKVTRDWDILGGLSEIRDFFENPDSTFDKYGLVGVSADSRANDYLGNIRSLLSGRSLHAMLKDAFSHSGTFRIGGGEIDDDPELMWLDLKTNGVNSGHKHNVLALAKLYDEAVNNYIGSSTIYRDILLLRGLTPKQLDNLFEVYKGTGKDGTLGFEWNVEPNQHANDHQRGRYAADLSWANGDGLWRYVPNTSASGPGKSGPPQ